MKFQKIEEKFELILYKIQVTRSFGFLFTCGRFPRYL